VSWPAARDPDLASELPPDEPRPDLFAAPSGEFESQAMTVVADGLARGAEPRLVKRATRLRQCFEKLSGDTLHALARV